MAHLTRIGSYGIQRLRLICATKKTTEARSLEEEGRKLSMSQTRSHPHKITLKDLLSRRI
eukprot:13594758-Heterocapsa_arctica.AAC.1